MDDNYNLPVYLPGTPPMYGLQQQAKQYFQGTDIVIYAQLTDNCAPVDYNAYFLKAILKDTPDSPIVTWVGYNNSGILFVNGVCQLNIPAASTTQLQAGTYYISLIGRAKANVNHIAVLFQQTISLLPADPSIINILDVSSATVVTTVATTNPSSNVPIDYFSI